MRKTRYLSIKVGVKRGIPNVIPGHTFVKFARTPTPAEIQRDRYTGNAGRIVYRNPTASSLARAQRAQITLAQEIT